MAISGMSVYMEFAAIFPNRSGAQTAYLEQAYPRPRYVFPAVFAFQTVVFSFSSSNAIVLSQYVYRMAGVDPTAWQMKSVAVAGYTIAALCLVFSTKYSLWLSNAISFVKVLVLLFIIITGFVVLGGNTRVEDPTLNFRNSFEGTSNAPYGITNALMKVVFAYSGYENAFNVVNEIKVREQDASPGDPMLTRIAGSNQNIAQECTSFDYNCIGSICARQCGILRSR